MQPFFNTQPKPANTLDKKNIYDILEKQLAFNNNLILKSRLKNG